MKLGLHYWNYTTPADPALIAPTLAETAVIAEEAGFASFTVMDHFFQMEGMAGADEPMLEGYTTLGYLAGLTRRMTLGLLVTGVMYRNPGVLAKTVTTLDVLSGGRGRLGIGASWYEREQRGLGIAVVPVAERFERLEETLRICLQMWSDDNGPFTGKHYQLAETLCVPAPLSRPRPPIMIGGGGEKKTLRLVARYADACNVFGSPEGIARKYRILADHCAEIGRDPDEIERSTLQGLDIAVGDGHGSESPAAIVDRFGELYDAGAEHIIASVRGLDDPARLERLGSDVLPALHAL